MDFVAPPPSAGSSSCRRTENFPVASWLLARRHRSALLAFYALARQADDIADDAYLSASDKLSRLDRFSADLAALSVPGKTHLQSLLCAFYQDVRQSSYANWPTFLAYCRWSAVPVGRFMLELHRQPAETQAPGDALCIALQCLNHLQDCADDWRRLGRCYLPESDLRAEGALAEDLAGVGLTPALRRVFDRLLDRCDLLLVEALPLLERIADWRLRLEASVILALAQALALRLRRCDPLSLRVTLSLRHTMWALARAIALASHASLKRRLPFAPKTSFAAAMAQVAPERRKAMLALYRFCRTIDDIADSSAAPEDKLAALQQWRWRILTGDLPEGLAAYRLPAVDFLAVIDGMIMDAIDAPVAPSLSWLDLYCERVASAVGRLSIRLFGSERAEDLAVAGPLGRALQLVNILRDCKEDAARLRLYFPEEMLIDANIHERDPILVLRHPNIKKVHSCLIQKARYYFSESDRLIAQSDQKFLYPALLMRDRYFKLLEKIEKRTLIAS